MRNCWIMSAPVDKIVMQLVENEIDNEIERMKNLDDNELGIIRQQRINELKRRQADREKWLEQGRGKLCVLEREHDFFEHCKQNSRSVCFFWTDQNPTTSDMILTKMAKIAKDHPETKFLRADLLKFPFLSKKLLMDDCACIVAILNTRIIGPMKCEFRSIEHTRIFIENLVTRLEDHNLIDSNAEDAERRAILMNLRKGRGISTKPIRDMGVTFTSNLSSDEDDTEQRSVNTENDRLR
ncbi:hypothetical protein ACOME3_006757 [Neoechinorhynchus agilis]